MKRLKKCLLSMESNTANYNKIYEGAMSVISSNGFSYLDYDSTYYNEDIGFGFEHTNKLAQDKPSVKIIIPAQYITNHKQGEESLKRLKHYLLSMEPKTANYKEMYEGETVVNFPPKSNGEILDPELQHDTVYWQNDVSYDVSHTHKLAIDKPTFTIHVPAKNLGFETYEKTAADYCLRALKPYIDDWNTQNYNRSRPDKENGKFYIHVPGGKVLIRNTAYFKLCPQKDYINGKGNSVYLLDDGIQRFPRMCLCITIQVQLPNKKIRKTIQMLCRDLPDMLDSFIRSFDTEKLNSALLLAEKQTMLRKWLKNSNYCAFIGNGSILPRLKGGDLPMKNAVPFISEPEDEIEIFGMKGMGIKRGVTVITGGGYSGKSTLLDALSAGIYNHIEGDGREFVITDESAVKISAEDGRSVKNVNISPFIKWLPSGETSNFSSDHASGSTSQAANIMEAVKNGAKVLLIDEDKSATNFMIRDKMMKTLIEKEPITPFTDRVNELNEENSVSTILVIGGSGEYLYVADNVYMMQDFVISNVTKAAKKICSDFGISNERCAKVNWNYKRTLLAENFTSYPKDSGTERLEVSDMGFILIGDERIDIRMLHNIVSKQQLNSIGFILRYIELSNNEHKINIERKVDELYEKIEKEGLDIVFSSFFSSCERFLDMPRKNEVLSVINRMRNIRFIIE